MQMSAAPFYQSAVPAGIKEDYHVIREEIGIVAVADGVSEAYVGKPIDYGLWESGGQMSSMQLCNTLFCARDGFLADLLLEGNKRIHAAHLSKNMDYQKQAVGGACVAACQRLGDEVFLIVAGDSGILWHDAMGAHYFTNFDEVAYVLEENGNLFFEQCAIAAKWLELGSGWQVYDSFFAKKQKYRANAHLGSGGHAIFNGDDAVKNCWTEKRVSVIGMDWMILLTDGFLTRDFHPSKVNSVAEAYNRDGIPGMLKLAGMGPELPHVKRPEGTAIVLTFK